jgi:hypothetical protein
MLRQGLFLTLQPSLKEAAENNKQLIIMRSNIDKK